MIINSQYSFLYIGVVGEREMKEVLRVVQTRTAPVWLEELTGGVCMSGCESG
jgi:hypothetical protein